LFRAFGVDGFDLKDSCVAVGIAVTMVAVGMVRHG